MDNTHSMRTRAMSQSMQKTDNTSSIPSANATEQTKSMSADRQAKLYRVRDQHEAFFRTTLKAPPQLSKRKNKKKKKTAGLGLTTKQRQKEARAHYIIHHGTAKDAKLFLNGTTNTNNIAAETHAALTLMLTTALTC